MSQRFRRGLGLALCAVFAGTVVSAVGAVDRGKRPPMDPRGEPSGMKKGVTECFKVWHNDDGWHVRVVNGRGSRDHKYQGTISVENGVFENVQSHLAKKNGAEKQWRQGQRKNELTFDFSTDEREDGINFKTSRGASAIRFSLKIDGKEVPQQIYVGGRGDNPDTSTFTVAAHPTNKSVERVSGNNNSNGIK